MQEIPRVHAVANDEILAREDFLERAEQMTRRNGTVVAIHLRGRKTSALALLERGQALQQLRACRVIVNDRVDIALALKAAGVHLRADSLPIDRVRSLVGDAMWIGQSVHSYDEARAAAAAGANYLFLGSIFETPSHPGQPPLGPGAITRIAREVAIPVIAIGGIDPSNGQACYDHGAYGLAAIRSAWFWEEA